MKSGMQFFLKVKLNTYERKKEKGELDKKTLQTVMQI